MIERVRHLHPAAPYRLAWAVWALRRRPENQVDRWDGHAYRRVFVTPGGTPVAVKVTQAGPATKPELVVTMTGAKVAASFQQEVLATLERMLGVQINLAGWRRLVARDPHLAALARPWRGFRPPRYASVFEALVNAVACQQLTLTMGVRLINQLAVAYGVASPSAEGPCYSFPTPAALARANHDDLRRLKFSYRKAAYLTTLAQAVESGALDVAALETMDDREVVERLCRLPGVGRWSAEYVLLRGLGRTHVFPADDVGARNHLQRWLALPEPLDYAGVQHVLRDWQPYGGLIYLHLLLKGIAERGWM